MSSLLLYPISDAAAQLGVGRTTLYELIRDGQLRTVKIGRRVLVPRDELARYVQTVAG